MSMMFGFGLMLGAGQGGPSPASGFQFIRAEDEDGGGFIMAETEDGRILQWPLDE